MPRSNYKENGRKARNIYKAALGALYVTFACRENKKKLGKISFLHYALF
jgi:hypothetical protein